MKRCLLCLWLLMAMGSWGQNVWVDAQAYTPQQLVEEVLIDSNCIENVVVTNVVGGNFGNAHRSYGYFNANGSSFPFQEGIILSTGNIANAQGPNTTLSDDDAPNWTGDADLEAVLNESNTLNATILEFEFTSAASQISFRYLFASEEYQENNANTCQYSDLFGFLIRPATAADYTNIALVPDTQTPVKVTTVHPGIPGGCDPINAFYFDSWNGPDAPINFNGQTKILTATATVVPNETYHVKLVIADEQNYRYDSAVFLEAGSFELATDLGPNRLVSTGNALCHGESLQLQVPQANATGFQWSRDGVVLPTETTATLTVSQAGNYSVAVTLGDGCISYGAVVIEYYPEVVVADAILTQCDADQDGLTFYDLYEAQGALTLNDQGLAIVGFFLTPNEALANTGAIADPQHFQNTVPNQTVHARIENQAGCFAVAALQLAIASQTLVVPPQHVCDDAPTDGYADFDLSALSADLLAQLPEANAIVYFPTLEDAFADTNSLALPYRNTTPHSQTIYVKASGAGASCHAIAEVVLNVRYTPTLEEDETVHYCTDTFPEPLRLYGGVLNDAPNNYYYAWFHNGMPTGVNTTFYDVNEVGTYTVIVTDPNGCAAQRDITVLPSQAPTILDLLVQEGTTHNTVTVLIAGEGTFEYALDAPNGPYQASNTFSNVPPGLHTVFVRNVDGCHTVVQDLAVLGFPKFFTPNGDAHHPTWQVYGVSAQFHQEIDIKIFNRHGKLLAHQNHLSGGWDGTYNGHPLPSDDYWFVATLPDGRTYRGHFALVR